MTTLYEKLCNKLNNLPSEAIQLPHTSAIDAVARAAEEPWTANYILQEQLRSGEIVTFGVYSMVKLLEAIKLIWLNTHPPKFFITKAR